MLEIPVAAFTPTIRLVVTADGFGASDARTRGILAAHRDGILTGTSVRGNAPDRALIMAQLASVPRLGTGVMLVLTGGAPVAPIHEVPSLLGPAGNFPPNVSDVLLAWAKASLRANDLEREFDAQVSRWRDAGLRVEHLCSEAIPGALPIVAAATENVARKHGITGLRILGERPTLAWAADVPRGLATAAIGVLGWYNRRHMGPLRHGPQTWGHFDGGHMDEIRLLEILGRLGPGSHEILCSPDSDESGPSPGDRDRTALCAPRVREAVTRRRIELCRWADLF